MALYIGSASETEKASAPISPDTQAEGMKAWGDWMGQHAASIVDSGGPLGPTMRASKAGITKVRNNLAGYVIVQAESHDAAARIFAYHPHFAIFPGDSVEIVECLAMPGT